MSADHKAAIPLPGVLSVSQYIEQQAVLSSAVRGTTLKSMIRQSIPANLRPRLRTALTRAMAPVAANRAGRWSQKHRPLRLHLGCGSGGIGGWINVDMIGAAADLVWDLRWPLPFKSESIDAIFHEHLLEHLALPEAVGMIKECFRLLRPGGILRMAVPNFPA